MELTTGPPGKSLSCLFDDGYSNRYECYLIVVLIFISLMTSDQTQVRDLTTTVTSDAKHLFRPFVYLLWINFYLGPLPIFLLGYLFFYAVELYEFLIYFEYESLIRDMV